MARRGMHASVTFVVVAIGSYIVEFVSWAIAGSPGDGSSSTHAIAAGVYHIASFPLVALLPSSLVGRYLDVILPLNSIIWAAVFAVVIVGLKVDSREIGSR